MNRLAIVSLLALSACGDFAMPDFRNMGSGDAGASDAAAPAPVQLTATERLIAAAEGQGCKINVDTVTAIMTDAALSQEDLVQATLQLQAAGLAEVAGEGEVQLKTPNCAA